MVYPQNSRYIAGCFFTDTSGIFEVFVNPLMTAAGANTDSKVTTLQAAMDSEKRSQWLVLVRPQGVMEVRSSLKEPNLKLTPSWSDMEPAEVISSVLDGRHIYITECAWGLYECSSTVSTTRTPTEIT